MHGLLFGALAFFAFAFVARRVFWYRHAFAYGGGCGPAGYYGHGPGFGHFGPFGHGRRGRFGRWGRPSVGPDGMARAAGEVLKRRLRIDEEQEPVVDHALVDVRSALKELSAELQDSRAALADALRAETVDDAALAAVFARQDDALARARRQVVSATKQVHAVLDADQRKLAADWIAAGKGTGWV